MRHVTMRCHRRIDLGLLAVVIGRMSHKHTHTHTRIALLTHSRIHLPVERYFAFTSIT